MTFDAAVFDVDGVLVDTDASYTEAVVRTVHHFLVREAGIREDAEGVDRDVISRFRRSGSWNNDWDLTQGLISWLLAAPGATTGELRERAEPVATASRRALAELVTRAGLRAPWSWDEIRGVFEEIYNGSAVAAERYGVQPRLAIERGLGSDEPILLQPELLAELARLGITKIGVVTGRSAADFAQVRKRLPLPEGTAVATDDDARKPDPALLERVLASLDARNALTVGDTLDDLRMALAYAITPAGRRRPVTPVVLCTVEDEVSYRAAGARLFVRHIADLPRLVGSLA